MRTNLGSRWDVAMGAALVAAEEAVRHHDVPIGAVLVDDDGRVAATAHNRREVDGDPTAHAELLALRSLAVEIGSWRLSGFSLVVTLEPCAMCAMAAVWARVDRIVYGAADPKAGAVWSLYNIPQDERLNHRCDVVHGVRAEECAALLSGFFGSRRDS